MPNDIPDYATITVQRTALIDTSGFSALETSGFYTVSDTTARAFTFTLPAGTQSVRLDAFTSAAGSAWTNFKITGNVSGKTYFDVSNGSFPTTGFESDDTFRPLACDTAITFSLKLSNTTPVSFILSAQGFAEEVVAELGGNIGVLDGHAIVVRTDTGAASAPWQSPTNTIVLNGSNVNAGATITYLAGTSGKQVWVHGTEFSTNAGAAAANSWLFDDTTGVRMSANSNTAMQDNNPVTRIDHKGKPMTAGAGLRATNQNGGALALYGQVDYSLK